MSIESTIVCRVVFLYDYHPRQVILGAMVRWENRISVLRGPRISEVPRVGRELISKSLIRGQLGSRIAVAHALPHGASETLDNWRRGLTSLPSLAAVRAGYHGCLFRFPSPCV